MAERNTPTFTFSRRMGYTHFDVSVTCSPDAKATYEEKLLELIRNIPQENAPATKEAPENQQTA